MRRKNGFTLIEVLAVLVILAVLLGIALPAIGRYLRKGNLEYYRGLETDILAAGRDYLLDYKSLYPREIGNSTVVTMEELTENKYISVPKDEEGNSCDGTVTVIKKGTNRYEYHVCLQCGDKYTSDEKECSYVGNNNEARNYNIELNADLPATVEQCGELTIPEATVTERVGNETNLISTTIKGNPSSIDTTVLSTNTITWSYRTKKVTRTVQVVDTVAPVIESIKLSKTSGTNYGGEITNKDTILQITAKDYACEAGSACRTKYPKLDGSGIKAVYYKEKEESDWHTYPTSKNEITIPLNQTFYGTLQVKVVDNAGRESAVKELAIQMDKTKPTKTTVRYLSGSSSERWQNNIQVELSASDDVQVAYYEIYKNGSLSGTTGPIWTPLNNFSSDSVTFRAVDVAGNKGAFSDIQKIHMDTERPTKTTVDLNGYRSDTWTNQDVKQSFSATDNVKVTYYEYAYSEGTSGTTTSNPWIISTDGEWTIWVRASDEAGNKGEWSNTYIVKRDTKAPTCSLKVTNNPNKYDDYYIEEVKIDFASMTDERSQIASSSIDRPSISNVATAAGGDTITGTVTDHANNTNTCTLVVKADMKTPASSPVADPLNLGNQDYAFKENVDPGFGPAGGTVTCSPPESQKTGTYNVTCTARGNNGKEGTVTFKVQHSFPASSYTYSCEPCETYGCKYDYYSFCDADGPCGYDEYQCHYVQGLHCEVAKDCQTSCSTCTGYRCPAGTRLEGTTCYY